MTQTRNEKGGAVGVYRSSASTSLLEQIQQNQRERRALDQVRMGTNSLLKLGVATRVRADFLAKPTLTDAYVKNYQQYPSQIRIDSRHHYALPSSVPG